MSVVERVLKMLAPFAEKADRSVGWDRLPPRLGIAALLGLRYRLRDRNLYDTRRPGPRRLPGTVAVGRAGVRTLDGTSNDPDDPQMGARLTPFGRNAPPEEERDGLYTPHPLEVSERLLTRQEFFPAETLNLLAAAWIQFEVHDWFAHRTGEYAAGQLDLPDEVPATPRPLARDPALDPRYPPFVSDQTHWWDASQLYGARPDFANAIRTGEGGRVLEDEPLLEVMECYQDRVDGTTAAIPNLWLGSALIHVLFANEHNAICEELARTHPRRQRDDAWLYEKARLINAAVMAKIHTVEWTPAVVGHPASAMGAEKTWYGLVPARYRKPLERFHEEVLTGLPGSRVSQDGASYALTEEFVAVYRMHQLIPDEVKFMDEKDPRPMLELTVAPGEEGKMRPRKTIVEIGWENAIRSLARAVPGEITLHNHPQFLQAFEPRDPAPRLNLGEIDILRTRQTGVPRYNAFRRLFRLEPATTFHDVANGNPQWAKEIRDVYNGKLEAVDLLIGMFAERKPRGFAFSDTAFRVFLLMATRRLRSDRFFTTDYTPEVYTPEGLRWIDEASFSKLIARHHPGLTPAGNPFKPWR
jgi:Animal haem peroxidase